jgi:protein-S-isoprenylcysteine O-methyltransferase Ste14
MQRHFILIYGLTAYGLFLACATATIGFVGGLYGKTIDDGSPGPAWLAAVENVCLIAAFALHHSLAARPRFKAWLTRVVPPAAERSTYVLAASLLLLLLIWQWRPIGGYTWHLENTALRGLALSLYAGGWLLVVLSTFLINHWELFGVSQVLRRWRNLPAPDPEFRLPLLYRLMRHPMHTGVLIVCWATPTMTVGHLLFATTLSAYIVFGSELEERDLVGVFGEAYRRYRDSTPRLFPFPRRRI